MHCFTRLCPEPTPYPSAGARVQHRPTASPQAAQPALPRNPQAGCWQTQQPTSRFRLLAASTGVPSAPAAAPSPPQIQAARHTLEDGMELELLTLAAQQQSAAAVAAGSAPPLLFIHGSYHGAWCWSENFLPYFSTAGYNAIALSLRAQGKSDRGDLKVSGTLQSHADDLGSVIAALPQPPVLVGHSFGGLLVEKYASQLGQTGRPPVAGVALLCSVPPTGNKGIAVRITKRSISTSFKITWAFVTKSFSRSLDSCRETFFSADLPKAQLERYQRQLAACSPVRLLNVGALDQELPIPSLPASVAQLPAFVGGGETDLVVDLPAVAETAAHFGTQPVIWPDMAHDCMLDTRWEVAAASLRQWLDQLPRGQQVSSCEGSTR